MKVSRRGERPYLSLICVLGHSHSDTGGGTPYLYITYPRASGLRLVIGDWFGRRCAGLKTRNRRCAAQATGGHSNWNFLIFAPLRLLLLQRRVWSDEAGANDAVAFQQRPPLHHAHCQMLEVCFSASLSLCHKPQTHTHSRFLLRSS